MATRQNTPRQNYGNPFSAGSSVAQGAALAAPGFVDYSQYFDTSATTGLQAAQQGLFTQIALANEQHATNMENILPADFDETKLAPGSVDGTYEMLRGLKDQAYELSRTASNFRGTKKGDMAQMELNKIKSQMSKHYGNNVEYNSMMLDHNKYKDNYSQSFNVIPGKAEEYQKYVKFIDPSAKISYDGKTMMIESKDGDKISFEELKKLEPAMQETEAILGIDQLATTIVTEAGNGKKVNDATIDFTVASIFNKAYQEGGDRLNVLTSLATDMSKEVGGQKFDFYNYLKSSNDLAGKYLNSDGSFNIPEDPSERAEYAKSFESDFKNYLKETMQTVRKSGIDAYTKDLREEEQRKINLEIDVYNRTVGKSKGKPVDYSALDNQITTLYNQFNRGDLSGVEYAINSSRDIRAEGSYSIQPRLDENENVIPGEFELFNDPPGAATAVPTGKYFSTKGNSETKKQEFNKLMGFVSGDVETAYNRQGGLGGTLAFEGDVVEETTNDGGVNPFISGDVNEQIEDNWPDFNAMTANQLKAFANKLKNAKVVPGSVKTDEDGNEIESSYEIDGVTLTGKQKDVFYNNLVGTEGNSGLISRTTATENNAENLNTIDRMLVNAQIEKPGNNFLTIDSEGNVFPIGRVYSSSAIKKYDAVLTNLDKMKAGDITGEVREKIDKAVNYLNKLKSQQKKFGKLMAKVESDRRNDKNGNRYTIPEYYKMNMEKYNKEFKFTPLTIEDLDFFEYQGNTPINRQMRTMRSGLAEERDNILEKREEIAAETRFSG